MLYYILVLQFTKFPFAHIFDLFLLIFCSFKIQKTLQTDIQQEKIFDSASLTITKPKLLLNFE
jgi:hypothetical protein